ncbi:MAG: MarR family transcriptional regulator [Rhodospirillaceae bacterium]|nr:MarR family transcriptional regulator [Rhodospirillaceae bacterium]
MSNVPARTSERLRLRNGGAEEDGTAPRRRRGAIDLGVLHEHIGYVVRRAQIAVFKDFIRTLAPVDVRPAQFSVLLVIAQNPGLTQAELGRALAIKRANLVGMLNELERRKLARRVPSPGDRRSYALYLSPAGAEILATSRKLALAHEKRACRSLSADEKRTLLALLARVEASLA